MTVPTIDLPLTGANITRLRKAAGLTVRDLQAVFGFTTPQAIYKWQSGASLLNVKIDDILVLRTVANSVVA